MKLLTMVVLGMLFQAIQNQNVCCGNCCCEEEEENGQGSDCTPSGCCGPDAQATVIDNGSGMVKAGFAGDDAPRAVFPKIVRNRAQNKRRILETVLHPIIRGINNDNKWPKIIFNELRVAPEEHPVLLAESPFNTHNDRAKMAKILFQTYNVPAMYVESAPVLALSALDRRTGVVIRVGYGVTYVAPIYNGHVLREGLLKVNVGKKHLLDYMSDRLTRRGFKSRSAADLDNVYDRLTYVALDFERELQTAHTRPRSITVKHEFPDGEVVTFGVDRFMTPELLFEPRLGVISKGIHQLLVDSINKCDVHKRRELYGNIVLEGEGSMPRDIEKRLEKEIKLLAPNSFDVRIIAPRLRKHLAWVGGSKLASLSFFQKFFLISKDEYDEFGPCILRPI